MKKIIYTIVVVLVVILAIQFIQSNSAGKDNAVKIGVLVPLTGKFAGYGEDVKVGLEIAKKDLGQKGSKIEFIFEDSAADPKVAVSAAQKLINVDKVSVIIGGPGSSANLAVAPMAEKSKVAFLVISSTPKLNDAGHYVVKLQPDIDVEVKRMSEYAKENSINKIGVIFDSTSETNIVGNELFKSLVEKSGGVVVSEGIDGKASDYRAQLANLKSENVQAVYFLPNEKVSGIALRQAYEIGIKAKLLGWSAIDGTEFFKSVGDIAEGMVITDLPFDCDSQNKMRLYCDKYKEYYNDRIPFPYGTYAYDALNVMMNAKHSTSVDIIDSFTNKEYLGVSGEYVLDQKGNLDHPNLPMRKLVDGKFVDLR